MMREERRAAARVALDRAISEAQLQRDILEMADRFGFRAFHHYDSRRQDRRGKGFPDLVLVKAPLIVFAELKDMRRDPTSEQVAWLEELGQCREVRAHLIRPSNLAYITRLMAGQATSEGRDDLC